MAGRSAKTVLITGGAGFIGSNLAASFLREGSAEVRVLDNLSRPGVALNLEWLRGLAGADRLEFVDADVRDQAAVTEAVRGVDEIYHLAAQVAVTTSIEDPAGDLQTNILGTFHVLEAARLSGRKPFVLFTSTNKVYGSLHGVPVVVEGTHYRAEADGFRGVDEAEPLDFHSPYGCSKGAADQYVRDYGRIYGLPTAVLRMSCIAGGRQFGTEDQGWVAHFLYSVLEGRPITVYGDGFQVRDILHVEDLVAAIHAVRVTLPRTAGEIYNVGGGPERAISVVEMLEAIGRETGRTPRLRFSEVRPGDQPLYISDTGKLEAHTGWRARRSCADILCTIREFWESHGESFSSLRGLAPVTAVETELVPQEVA